MGFFSKRLKSQPAPPPISVTAAELAAAREAVPQFYSGAEGEQIGGFTLREGQVTRLPKAPEARYRLLNQDIAAWQLSIISLTHQDIVAYDDYQTLLSYLKPYWVEETAEDLIIGPLSSAHLDALFKS